MPPDPVVLAVFLGAFGVIVLFMVYLSYTLAPDDERWDLMAADSMYGDWRWWSTPYPRTAYCTECHRDIPVEDYVQHVAYNERHGECPDPGDVPPF